MTELTDTCGYFADAGIKHGDRIRSGRFQWSTVTIVKNPSTLYLKPIGSVVSAWLEIKYQVRRFRK